MCVFGHSVVLVSVFGMAFVFVDVIHMARVVMVMSHSFTCLLVGFEILSSFCFVEYSYYGFTICIPFYRNGVYCRPVNK